MLWGWHCIMTQLPGCKTSIPASSVLVIDCKHKDKDTWFLYKLFCYIMFSLSGLVPTLKLGHSKRRDGMIVRRSHKAKVNELLFQQGLDNHKFSMP